MSLTLNELIDEIRGEGFADDEVREEATHRMKELIKTKITLQGPPPPNLLAGVNTDHIMALFIYLIELVMADATDDQVAEVVNDFQSFREFDVTARHYSVYLHTEKE